MAKVKWVEAINPCSEGFKQQPSSPIPTVLDDMLEVHHPALVHFIPAHISLSLQLELQCHELNSEKQESHVENVKLKMTNDELSRALESTSQELSLAQEQLTMLQEQAAQLHQEKEMWAYAPIVHI